MNKIKNASLGLLLSGALCVPLAACGGGSEAEAPPKPEKRSEAPQKPEKAPDAGSDTEKVEKDPAPAAPTPEPTPEETEPEVTASQEQAVLSAESYLTLGGFSKAGLIDQLKFEQFSQADAEYAVENVDADWNAQAVMSAESYVSMGGFSRASLIDQLVFEKFTQTEAEYAVDKVGL